ncbi:hypothetical protein FBU30_003731, partial [Linnemannia zychae]
MFEAVEEHLFEAIIGVGIPLLKMKYVVAAVVHGIEIHHLWLLLKRMHDVLIVLDRLVVGDDGDIVVVDTVVVAAAAAGAVVDSGEIVVVVVDAVADSFAAL